MKTPAGATSPVCALGRPSVGRDGRSRAGKSQERRKRGRANQRPSPPSHPRRTKRKTHLERERPPDRLELARLDDQMASVEVGDDELVLGREDQLVPVEKPA